MNRRVIVELAWGDETMRLGTLFITASRGKEQFAFECAEEWLEHEKTFEFDPHIPLTRGIHYPKKDHPVFGCLADASPDRWGIALLRRRENRQAFSENRTARSLSHSDFLFGVSDAMRMGALRFRDGETLLADTDTGVPKITWAGTFYALLQDIQAGRGLSDNDIRDVVAPGASLGGSRPKASLCDADGKLFVVKFPQVTDSVDVPLWEKVSLDMAKRCGIRVPESRLIQLSQDRHALVLDRFDRDTQGGRIPFASAMTLLEARDNDGKVHSYLEIAMLLQLCGSDTTEDLRELWTRMLFNVLTSNRDDHLRNHGFLRNECGWRLSPVYDLESSSDKAEHCLAFDEHNTEPDARIAFTVAGLFGLTDRDAQKIAERMGHVLRKWKNHAERRGAKGRDIDAMRENFALPPAAAKTSVALPPENTV
ncbi:MAG: type II toxin-antitoxin system HipA family toxin [Desulfovibrio sp.]|nr:type II toxin-antitoxin system HipA family toxin [Desulfovibrio sp.]